MNNCLLSKIGQDLALRMIELELDLNTLSQMSGVGCSKLNRILSGMQGDVSIKDLYLIAEAMGVSVDVKIGVKGLSES